MAGAQTVEDSDMEDALFAIDRSYMLKEMVRMISSRRQIMLREVPRVEGFI